MKPKRVPRRLLAEVRTPKYRQRIERDRTKYTRKRKHKGTLKK